MTRITHDRQESVMFTRFILVMAVASVLLCESGRGAEEVKTRAIGREAAPDQSETLIGKDLRQFAVLSKQVGRRQFCLDIYAQSPNRQGAKKLIGSSKNEITKALDGASKRAQQRLKELSKLYDPGALADLEDWSKDVGRLREQLRLFDLPQARSGDELLTRKELRRLADKVDNLVAEQLIRLEAAAQTQKKTTMNSAVPSEKLRGDR